MNIRAPGLGWVWLVLLATLVGIVPKSQAQTATRPRQLAQGVQPLAAVAKIELPTINGAQLRAADRQRPAGAPLRFAESASVRLNPQNSGTSETLANDQTVWRVRLEAPNALSINLGFGRYVMPANGQLFVYTSDYSVVVGPFTAADNERHGQLWTPILPGSDVVVELSVPTAELGQLQLELTSVNRGYTGFGLPKAQAPDSGACNVDVICPEGALWQPEIRAVAVYTVSGTYSCSGALINNTAQNMKPYFLTANHCVQTQEQASSVVTYWNYQSLVCRSGSPSNADTGAPLPAQALSGALLRASFAATDFTLLELDDPVPATFNPHWAGWDNRALDFPTVVGIHHPQGHEKRISFENDPITTTSYAQNSVPGDGTHIRVADWDVGTTEGGSSGSPLFNPDQRIIGQLHGGYAACGNNASDWYGRLSYSWAGGGSPETRLSSWLDPLNSGATTFAGRDAAPDFTLAATPKTQSICVGSSASYTINLEAVSNYNDSVTLTNSGAPAGTTVSLAPRTLTPPGSSQMTISVSDNATPGTAFIEISGTASTTAHSATVALDIANAVPAVPALTLPVDGATNQPTHPTLTWQSAAQASSYRVEIATSATFSTLVYSTTSATNTITVERDLNTNTTFFWRVQAINGCGAATYSASARFTTTSNPGSCPPGVTPIVLYSNTFEVSADDWTHNGNGDTWRIAATKFHSDSQAFHAENTAMVSDQYLISPPISIPAQATMPTLQFWNYQSLESAPNGCFDGAIIETSTDGTNWRQITNAELLTDPYDGIINSSSNPLNQRQAWCGDPQEWLRSVVDIERYAGTTVQFRFRLGTDVSTGRDGWYIDDVQVQACDGAQRIYLPLINN